MIVKDRGAKDKTLLKWTGKAPIHPVCGAIAQLGERIVRNDEVVGSSPTSSTIKIPCKTGISGVDPLTKMLFVYAQAHSRL